MSQLQGFFCVLKFKLCVDVKGRRQGSTERHCDVAVGGKCNVKLATGVLLRDMLMFGHVGFLINGTSGFPSSHELGVGQTNLQL